MRPIGLESTGVLSAGDVGYLTASIKNVKDTRVGDTVTHADNPVAQPLPGYRPAVPMVFSGIYPLDGANTRNCASCWKSCSSTTPPFS